MSCISGTCGGGAGGVVLSRDDNIVFDRDELGAEDDVVLFVLLLLLASGVRLIVEAAPLVGASSSRASVGAIVDSNKVCR